MSFLDYDPYYRCTSCQRRIHQSKISGSITGDVECCGRLMTRPGDPAIALAFFVGLCAVPLLWYLTALGFWGSLAVSGVIFLVVWRGLASVRDFLSKRAGA